jgi:hypothetical protein
VPLEQIQADHGHRYSGRNNDGKEGLGESLYQLRKFLGALWRSFQIGRSGYRAQQKKLRD